MGSACLTRMLQLVHQILDCADLLGDGLRAAFCTGGLVLRFFVWFVEGWALHLDVKHAIGNE